MLVKVISGSQMGSDLGGLYAAKNCNIQTGGWVLRNNKTETGDRPDLITLFDLTELNSRSYPQRTLANVNEADATWIFFYKKLDGGTELTVNYCQQLKKIYLLVDLASDEEYQVDRMIAFLNAAKPEILNIAGNRESKSPGIQEKVRFLLEKVFNSVPHSNKNTTNEV